MVEEIEGDDHRWQREMKTIIDVDGQLYAFDRMLEARRAADMTDKWQTARDVFRWWLEEDYTQYELSDEVWRKNDE